MALSLVIAKKIKYFLILNKESLLFVAKEI